MILKGTFFYNTLSPDEANRFITNYPNRKGGCTLDQYLNRTFGSMREFILSAFMWNTTPEGFHFWSEISER